MKLSEAIRMGCETSLPVRRVMKRIENEKLYACALGAAEITCRHKSISDGKDIFATMLAPQQVRQWAMDLNDYGMAIGNEVFGLPDAEFNCPLPEVDRRLAPRVSFDTVKIPFQHDYRLAIADALEKYGY